MDCSLVPLETSDPGLSEIPLLPLSHETKRRPCLSNFVAWALRRFLEEPTVVVLSTCPKPPVCLCYKKNGTVTAATCQIVFIFSQKEALLPFFKNADSINQKER